MRREVEAARHALRMDRKMKAQRPAVATIAFTAFTALTGAFPAQAHQIDPGGKIEVACPASAGVRMAMISRAVEGSHYWATRAARRQMLALAQKACESGATAVTFVPPADQRYTPDESEVADAAQRSGRAGT